MAASIDDPVHVQAFFRKANAEAGSDIEKPFFTSVQMELMAKQGTVPETYKNIADQHKIDLTLTPKDSSSLDRLSLSTRASSIDRMEKSSVHHSTLETDAECKEPQHCHVYHSTALHNLTYTAPLRAKGISATTLIHDPERIHWNQAASINRKVELSDLPPFADLTFVQSLIHGGAIASMKLEQSRTGTAVITFVDPIACASYADLHAGGIAIDTNGQQYTIMVKNTSEHEAMDDLLKSKFAAGATRVVKVMNVSHKLSMHALHQLALGEDQQRPIEIIRDTLRNEVRTVIFRFANIGDALSFHNDLDTHGNPSWNASDIEYVTDPCENATGFHFEI